jgi:pimeloyl-ACP methyl ester carboxylesterase
MSDDAGFEEFFLDADGFNIRYLAAGPEGGAAVVCLHGAGGPRVSILHAMLSEQYRTIVFEAPGFGESPENEHSQTMWDLARTMNLAVATLNLGPVKLLGNSFGGKLALCMASLSSEDATASLIEALVLIAPAAIRPDPEPRLKPEERLATMFAHPERQPPRAALSKDVAAKQGKLFRRLIGPARDAALEAEMATIEIPTLALFGTSDRLIPSAMARHYNAIMPECHTAMVYDAAHAIDSDRPEATFAIVADFLENRSKFLVKSTPGLLYR